MAKVGLYELLPLIIRMRDEEASGAGVDAPLLKRIVGTVQDEHDAMVALIAGMRDLINTRTTTDLILSLLGQQLGFTEFPWATIVNEPREYANSQVDGHKVRGCLLGILRDMQARNIADKTYIWELFKTERHAVDDYVVTEEDAPYGTADRAARVIFIDDPTEVGAPVGGPDPSDGSTIGVFAIDQIPYSTAKLYRESLNNVFPIHVIIPVPTIRTAFDDVNSVPTDDLGGVVYALFLDNYRVDHDELAIITECVANCQVSCQERCETLCELTCETTCETSCQAECEDSCQATCQNFCQGSCESGCQDPCQNFCQSACEGICQAACEANCQQNCQFGCQSAGESCQSFCELNCQTDAELVCTDTCQTVCQTPAQQPCDPGTPPAGEGG